MSSTSAADRPHMDDPERIDLEAFALVVFLLPDAWAQLEAHAHREGTNMATVARKAIAAYMRPAKS